MAKIKAVLFDMDGTILDTEKIHKECWEQAMKDIGVDFSPTTFFDLIGLNDKSTCDYFKKNFGFTDEMYTKMSVSAYALSQEFTDTKGMPVKKGFFRLSDYLSEKGIKRAVVTSSVCSVALRNFQKAKIEVPFDVIVGGDSVIEGKPSAEPYLRAAEGLGLSPSECMVIEDSANGIISAHNAGIRCVYVKDMVDIPEKVKAMAEFEADSLDNVIGIIETIN
ncbi:MAG: HAD family phosphatase [Bacteroides sp.]|nr:HAD family phosphatase [Bacteroides sp.]